MYEQQYYILRAAEGDYVPFLGPGDDTVGRNLTSERQPEGSTPLIFRNTEREKNRAQRIMDAVAPILFHGTNPVVQTAIREALLERKIPNMFMHPAIYIDDRDNSHEDYWYITFTELFDCWDRALSDISSSYVETDGNKRYDVYEYVFDNEIMGNTPLEQRLLFKMGGTIGSFVFCHESIAGIFRRSMPNGASLVLAADY